MRLFNSGTNPRVCTTRRPRSVRLRAWPRLLRPLAASPRAFMWAAVGGAAINRRKTPVRAPHSPAPPFYLALAFGFRILAISQGAELNVLKVKRGRREGDGMLSAPGLSGGRGGLLNRAPRRSRHESGGAYHGSTTLPRFNAGSG